MAWTSRREVDKYRSKGEVVGVREAIMKHRRGFRKFEDLEIWEKCMLREMFNLFQVDDNLLKSRLIKNKPWRWKPVKVI